MVGAEVVLDFGGGVYLRVNFANKDAGGGGGTVAAEDRACGMSLSNKVLQRSICGVFVKCLVRSWIGILQSGGEDVGQFRRNSWLGLFGDSGYG